jgi:hypothetical protein
MDIYIGIWAKDRATLDSVLAQFGLLTGLVTADPQLHPDLRISGAGYSGWGGEIAGLPGVFANAWALDPPREQTGRKSLARNLRHLANQDGSETKIEQLKADGVSRKTLMERCRLTTEATAKAGGTLVHTKGTASDPKMPAARLEIKNGKGELIFAAYSLEPDDDNKPATPACVWA